MTAKKLNIQKLLAPAVLVLLYAFFCVFGENFFSVDYLMNILNASYYIGFLAIGVTFVIITGGIDLSLGTTMMCAALLGGAAYNIWHWNIWVSLALVVLVGTLIGLLNGVLVAYFNLPPFIATLGTQMMGMGFGAVVTKVMTMRYPTIGTPDGAFKYVFYKTSNTFFLKGFPIGAVWLALAFFVAVIPTRWVPIMKRHGFPASIRANGKPWYTRCAACSAAWRVCFMRRCIRPSFPLPAAAMNFWPLRAW